MLNIGGVNTWIISEVLHTVCFLFKNEFVLQNTSTGLQCNLRCALSQRSNFRKVLYSRLDAFVVDTSDYSSHIIRHLLNASEAFPAEWFLQFWEQVKVWWAEHRDRVKLRALVGRVKTF
jgi:hypothetical protein